MELWVGVGVAAVVLLYLVTVYNMLVAKRNQVRNGWSQIDVQLKRRHDLVPNLVNAVKGYLGHERQVIEEVTRTRAAAMAAGGVAGRAQAENALTQALRSLFAVAEDYPTLRANENVLVLQEELRATENRVAFARQFYNDAVQEYNTARGSFPPILVAGLLRFVPAEFFALQDPAERAVPQVQL